MQRQCLAARLSILALAVSIAACGSFSASSKSVSNLISSPIKSSSNRSSPEDAYQADVADYTAAYIKSGGDASKLKYEISSIAEKLKGMRAAGHMGVDRVTVRNLKVVKVDSEHNLMLVRGAVPGATGGYVIIRRAVAAKPLRQPQPEKPKGKK